MRSGSRSLAILLCLFLISFKVAASSIFIDAAIERAHMQNTCFTEATAQGGHFSKESADDKQQSHALFLMSHITANISNTEISVPFQSVQSMALRSMADVLYTQNIPDSAFKPPKVTT